MGMIRIFLRSLLRFFFGMVWFFVLIFLVAVLLCLGLACAAEGMLFICALVTGLLYLFTGDPQMYHQFWWWLLIATVGFGLSVAVFGLIWDVFSAIRGRVTPLQLQLKATPK
jgi:hypothetical protein